MYTWYLGSFFLCVLDVVVFLPASLAVIGSESLWQLQRVLVDNQSSNILCAFRVLPLTYFSNPSLPPYYRLFSCLTSDPSLSLKLSALLFSSHHHCITIRFLLKNTNMHTKILASYTKSTDTLFNLTFAQASKVVEKSLKSHYRVPQHQKVWHHRTRKYDITQK